MKSHTFFIIFFISHVIQCQATITKSVLAITIPVIIYAGTTRYIEKWTDLKDTQRVERLLRKDRDYICNKAIETLNKKCSLSPCKNMIELFEQYKTPPTQQVQDAIQESIEIATKSATYKTTNEYYETIKKTTNDFFKK